MSSIKDRLKFIAKSYLNSWTDQDVVRKARDGLGSLFESGPAASESETDPADLDLEKFHEELDERFRSEFADLDAELRRARSGAGAGTRGKAGGRPATRRATLESHYQTLGVKPGTPLDQVRARYIKLMKQHHPDRHAGDPRKQAEATRKSQAISEAWAAVEAELKKPT